MYLCSECDRFIKVFAEDASTSTPNRLSRSPSSFTESSFSCRVCAVVWTALSSRTLHGDKILQPICLNLSRPSIDQVVLKVETKGKGGTWDINGNYYKIPPEPETIRAFLQKHGYKDDPREYLIDEILELRFQRQKTLPWYDEADYVENMSFHDGECPLSQDAAPIEFFKKFIPQLTQWLETCDQHHSSCRDKFSSQTLPTRLVHVGKQPCDLRLCLGNQVPFGSRYLTMSYRWDTEFPCLRRSNYVDWCDRIPEDHLPQTIQDGIMACRLLQCDFIWIDALCIIQDSHDDWIRESGNMAAVYSGSYLNIAASSAKSADEGLFRRCNEFLNDVRPLTLWLGTDVYEEIRDESNRHRWLRNGYDLCKKDFEHSNLHMRGWVFQVREPDSGRLL